MPWHSPAQPRIPKSGWRWRTGAGFARGARTRIAARARLRRPQASNAESGFSAASAETGLSAFTCAAEIARRACFGVGPVSGRSRASSRTTVEAAAAGARSGGRAARGKGGTSASRGCACGRRRAAGVVSSRQLHARVDRAARSNACTD